jgi:ATP diphosphatase
MHEVLEAIETREDPRLVEELGDLLYLIVFTITIAEEQSRFTFGEIAEGISAKLIRRHPHVFREPPSARSAAQAGERWEAAKRAEKRRRGDRRGPLASGANTLPALLEAFRVQEKAAGFGFDWPAADQVLAKLDEERRELAAAMQSPPSAQRTRALGEELGDLLFTLVNLSRHLGEDPEGLLKAATRKFQRRFAGMERVLEREGPGLEAAGLETMEAAWQQAKREEPPAAAD